MIFSSLLFAFLDIETLELLINLEGFSSRFLILNSRTSISLLSGVTCKVNLFSIRSELNFFFSDKLLYLVVLMLIVPSNELVSAMKISAIF